MKMDFGASNMHAEGMINNEKNIVKYMKTKTNEPAVYWWYRYLNLHQGSKFLVSQMEQFDGYIERCKVFMNRKLKNNVAAEEMTDDARELETEDNTDMIWDRGRTWVDKEEDLRELLVDAFIVAGLGDDSLSSKFNSIDLHAGKDANGKRRFIFKPTFNKWMNRQPVKRLIPELVSVIVSYVNAHGT